MFSPNAIVKSLLTLIAYSLSSLKHAKVSIDTEIETIAKLLFKFSGLQYDDFLVDRVSGSKQTNQLWTPLLRCIELLFTFQKENFIKTCIEIRMKDSLYLPAEKRFPAYFALTSLDGKKVVRRDMLEHGRALKQVIAQLFEGVDESAIVIAEEEEWEPESEILPENIKDEGDVADEAAVIANGSAEDEEKGEEGQEQAAVE